MSLPSAVFHARIVNVPGKIKPVIIGDPFVISSIIKRINVILVIDKTNWFTVWPACAVSKSESKGIVAVDSDIHGSIEVMRFIIIGSIPVPAVHELDQRALIRFV